MKSFKILLSAALVGALAFSFSGQEKVEANPLSYSITVQDPQLAFSVSGTQSDLGAYDAQVVQSAINGATALFTDTIQATNNGNIETDIYAQVSNADARLTVVSGNPTSPSELSLQMEDDNGSFGFLNTTTPLKLSTIGPDGGNVSLRMNAFLGTNTPTSTTPYTFTVTYTAQATPTP